MKQYKKTLVGSLVAFFVGTSCCWLSSLAIWMGGFALMGVVINFIEEVQFLLIGAGVILLLVSIFLYLKNRKKANGQN